MPSISATGANRQLIVQPDVIDLRDRYYDPALVPLPQAVKPNPDFLEIRDQGQESACTGFALASVIDCQRKKLVDDANASKVSTRMLYEMARLHDDLPDADQAGSTLRGALKGFFHNGVCDESDAVFEDAGPFALTHDRAKAARAVSLGAYYRLNHEINDYHTAIAEAGAIIASAKIHRGWAKPDGGKIELTDRFVGRHAFAIVGYNDRGFLIQNSWGDRWGKYDGLKGIALWHYDDWFENVEDAWVLRLAISSPSAFSVKFARNHKAFRDKKQAAGTAFAPRRQDIMGHFLHLDDGKLFDRGRYAQTPDAVEAIVNRIGQIANCKNRCFDHMALITHGALQDRAAIAARAKAWLPVFRKNRIYPLHIMWETGFNNDVVNVINDLLFKTRARMGENAEHTDARLEELARPLGRKLWRDLKTTSELAMAHETEGGQALRRIVGASKGLNLHFVSASAGVLLLREYLALLDERGHKLETASLLAPACSVDFYDRHIRPHVSKTIRAVHQYSLIDKREREDKLDVYGKSMLYLVSNAIEVDTGTPLLGMERFVLGLDGAPPMRALPAAHKVYYAGRDRSQTEAKSHRGFEADRKTMNHLLETILGHAPTNSFQDANLSSY